MLSGVTSRLMSSGRNVNEPSREKMSKPSVVAADQARPGINGNSYDDEDKAEKSIVSYRVSPHMAYSTLSIVKYGHRLP